MKRFFLFLIGGIISFFSFSLKAEDSTSTRPTQFSLTLGGGFLKSTETYLSPYNYSGWDLQLSGERLRRYKNKEHLLGMQNLNIGFGRSTHGSRLSSLRYEIQADYTYTFLAPCIQTERFKLYAGGAASLLLGMVNNTRNTNNPANLRLAIELKGTAIATYSIPFKKKNILLRDVLSLPFMGLFFMPEFGGSYYEMYLIGNTENTAHFSFWHNRQSVSNLLTADFPVGNGWLRVGVQTHFSRMKENDLVSKTWINNFVVGYVIECSLFSPQKGSMFFSKRSAL